LLFLTLVNEFIIVIYWLEDWGKGQILADFATNTNSKNFLLFWVDNYLQVVLATLRTIIRPIYNFFRISSEHSDSISWNFVGFISRRHFYTSKVFMQV
jgi:hypothetical protein